MLHASRQANQGHLGEVPKFIKQHKEMKALRDPTSLGTFLDIFQINNRYGIGRGNKSPTFQGKERRPDMKTGQGNGGAFSWSGICEISREANSLSTLLPDAGRCTKTHLAHVDSVLPASRVRGSRSAIRETGHQAPAGGNSFPSFAK